ncbi:MAG: diphthine synthase [Thermoprotei archaeon]
MWLQPSLPAPAKEAPVKGQRTREKTQVLTEPTFFPFPSKHGLLFVGLGLYDDLGLSSKALEALKASDIVYIETYTSVLPGFDKQRFSDRIGKTPIEVARRDLEDKGASVLFESAKTRLVALAVPGDPFVATTHYYLWAKAREAGLQTYYVPGVSVYSAAYAASGLQVYKAGPSCTVVEPTETYRPVSQYDKTLRNMSQGLHTLMLLDLSNDARRTLSYARAAQLFSERLSALRLSPKDVVAVGIAALGSDKCTVEAASVHRLTASQNALMPQCMLVPGIPDETEAKALIQLGATEEEIAVHVATCKTAGGKIHF